LQNTVNGSLTQKMLNPLSHIWVSASAGSGKTKILIDRLLRFMLEGVEPAKLLCLTFTKAAAAEMLHRIQRKLWEWQSMPDSFLQEHLQALLGRPPLDEHLLLARKLLSVFLENPPPIQTIHSFCQNILQRFPIEAGVSSPFSIMEEGQSQAIWEEICQNFFHAPPDFLKNDLSFLLRHHSHAQIQAHLDELFDHRALGLTGQPPALETPEIPDNILTAAFWGEVDSASQPSEKDQIFFQTLRSKERFSKEYLDLFLTQSRDIRQRLISANCERKNPDLLILLRAEQEACFAYHQQQSLNLVFQKSYIYLKIADFLLDCYESIKKDRCVLDFQDLIQKTRHVLEGPENMGWVLYKMDDSIQHLLVDEAQDTSYDQWILLRSLGEALMNGPKTLFVVADPKQSIYSFQGADVATFYETNHFFKMCAQNAKVPFEEVVLDMSFRSTPPILSLVNAAFQKPFYLGGAFSPHKPCPHLEKKGGVAELWPILEASAQSNQILAQEWADVVRGWLETPFFLESLDRFIQPEDIMILFLKRDQLFYQFTTQFQKANIPTTGNDRLNLSQCIEIRDLMNALQFLQFPEDDFALASLLKGSLFGVSEEDLFALAYGRQNSSLYQALQQNCSVPFQDIYQMIQQWQELSRTQSPFFLLHAILYGFGRCHQMALHLGNEVFENIQEFLKILMRSEHRQNLHAFWRWFQTQNIIVKRDPMRASGAVRLMTVHGSKGLESPIVILPDICQGAMSQDLFYYVPSLSSAFLSSNLSIFKDFQQKRQNNLNAEHERLLYVAMTRAKERFYASGILHRVQSEQYRWIDSLEPAFQNIASSFDFQSFRHPEWKGNGYRFSVKAENPPPFIDRSLPIKMSSEKPLLLWKPPLHQPETPVSQKFKDFFHFGQQMGTDIHQLLEELADFVPEVSGAEGLSDLCHRLIQRKAYAFLKSKGYKAKQSLFWAGQIEKVFQHFPFLFGKKTYAEVTVPSAASHVQRIDRLIFQPQEVWVIDYKIDRHPPVVFQETEPQYQKQLHNYMHVIKALYPEQKVRGAFLWIAVSDLMWSELEL
jgi:ATP-dependent helicase/nuclease subunit A